MVEDIGKGCMMVAEEEMRETAAGTTKIASGADETLIITTDLHHDTAMKEMKNNMDSIRMDTGENVLLQTIILALMFSCLEIEAPHFRRPVQGQSDKMGM